MSELEQTEPETTEPGQCSYLRLDGKRCQHSKEQERDHCVLHLAEVSKDADHFERTFKETLEEQQAGSTLDIEGFVFPTHFRLADVAWGRLGKINARSARFTQGADFEEAQFAAPADFSSVEFHGTASFRGARMAGGAYFLTAQFEGNVDFRGAHFVAETFFEGARFFAAADFSDAWFGGSVFFLHAQFGSKVDFNHAHFEAPTHFELVRFGSDASFTGTKFYRATFAGTIVTATFADTQFGWGTSFEGADLRRVNFRRADLSGCLFAGGTGIEDCRFTEPTWHTRKGRLVLADEMALRWPGPYHKLAGRVANPAFDFVAKKDAFGSVEKAYRDLGTNYRNQDYLLVAQQFRFGEQEMRRCAKGGRLRRTVGSLVGWHWMLTGYGQRWTRALIWLIAALLIVLAALFGPQLIAALLPGDVDLSTA